MQAAAERMKRNADEKRREIQLDPRDQALFSTRYLYLAVAAAAKLTTSFGGSF